MNFIKGTLAAKDGGLTFREAGGGTVELRLGKREKALPFVGKEVVLGLRPEDCDLLPQGKAPGENCFQAVVDIVEPMGAETYFYLQTGAHTIISRSHAAVDHREAGHRLRFEANGAKTHVFDPATGMRIA